MIHQVAMPKRFFLEEAKKEYWNTDTRLISELLQNSVDAGATEIRADFTDGYYRWVDNGCGMNKQTLVNAMLTMGGSEKSSGSTGGFGAAKKLILFAHDKYVIRTRNIVANGNFLNYELDEDSEMFSGTDIQAWFLPDAFSAACLKHEFKRTLNFCILKHIKFILNGEEFIPQYQNPDLIDNKEGLGNLYINKDKDSGGELVVLHKGLYMFSTYLGCDLNKEFVLNIEDKDSKEVFSQSRDSFRGDYYNLYNNLVSELKTENLSATQKKAKKWFFQGENRCYEYIFKKIKENISDNTVFQAVQTFIDQNKIQEAIQLIKQSPNTLTEQDIKKIEFAIVKNQNENLKVDFYIDGDFTEDEVKRYLPNTGLKKYKWMVALYRAVLRDLHKIYEKNASFSLGFCFDAQGKYMMKDSKHIFYIDPEKIDSLESAKEKALFIMAVAKHEFTHCLGYSKHDEAFAAAFTEVVFKADVHLAGYTQYVKEARETKDII